MRTCVCDACGMEFNVEKLDVNKDYLGKDHQVEVISFTCPKCDELYVVAVRDDESAGIQKKLEQAKKIYKDSYDPNNPDKMRYAKKEVDFQKRYLSNYMSKLKKRYLKELRRRGQ